jgi:hypothetical protein
VSGAQKWNGTAEILNPNPTITSMTLPSSSGTRSVSAASTSAMPSSEVVPVKPYTIDMPKSISATDSTPMRKNFRAASEEYRSRLRRPGHHERGDGDGLERDEQQQQIAGRGHDHHADEGGQQQEVVLTLEEAALGEVAPADAQDREQAAEEEQLEDERVVAGDELPVEGGAVLPPQRDGEPDRDDRAEPRDRVDQLLGLAAQREVRRQHEERRDRQRDLRRDREEVDRHLLVPSRRCSGRPPWSGGAAVSR